MNYTRTAAKGVVLTAVGGSVLYTSLTIAAVVIASVATGIALAGWQRRRHDRQQLR
jgi:hypothetical protein